MLYLGAFYKWQQVTYYLSDIRILEENLQIECNICNNPVATLSSSFQNSSWRHNLIEKTADIVYKYPEECQEWECLNDLCSTCCYFSITDIDIILRKRYFPESVPDFNNKNIVRGRCRLRHEAFKCGCAELFYNCTYFLDKSAFKPKVLCSQIDLEDFNHRQTQLFFIDNRGVVHPQKNYILLQRREWSFNPEEFELFWGKDTKDQLVFGTSLESAYLQQEYIGSYDEHLWAERTSRWTFSNYLELFVRGMCEVVFLEDASLGIVWTENAWCYLIGEPEVISRYQTFLEKCV